MTDEILTPTERFRFDELPTSLSADDIVRYFTLSKNEIDEAKKCRGSINQVGFALQLCALRMIGRFPTAFKQVPIEIINYLSSQLDVDGFDTQATQPKGFLSFSYPQRERTKWEHTEKIRQITGFSPFDEKVESQLSAALREQAFQCNQSKVLMEFAREKLYQDRVVRPAVTTVERLVAQVRKQAEEEIFSLIYAQLDDRIKAQFSQLLVVEEGQFVSPLQQFWLNYE